MMTTNFEKTPIRFPSANGACAGDLYLPAGSRPGPVVIMAHGIGADRSFGLGFFAERFAAAGLACLVFDYRRFGESPGTPRRLVSPRAHVEDYLSAIRFARRHDRLDGERIGLWGTSFSGGHVLVTAARAREDVRAVVAQVPFVSGISSSLAYPLRYLLPATAVALADGLAGLARLGRLTVPVARERGLALLASPDAYPGLRAIVPEDTPWPVRVPAQVFLSVLGYHPTWRAAQVRAPTLIVAGTADALCPVRAVRRTARQLRDCRLEEFPIGHFDGYRDDWFDRFVRLEARFFQERLGVEHVRAPEPS